MKRTGPTNTQLGNLIKELKKNAIEQNIKLWKRIAFDLEKPTRKRRVVNLARIDRYTREGEIIVVPGKVLASGFLNHKLTIAAQSFSRQAIEKIKKIDADYLSIEELLKKNPKGKKVKIIG